jgi:ADP-ribose pyrophosphatase YjhB (NUDIX family)
MVIEIFADGLDRAHINKTTHRIACRGVVLREGKLLGEFYKNRDVFNLPGGGLEPGESPEACCVREVAEETGVKVRVMEATCVVMEYFPEATFETRFFKCEVAGASGSLKPTPEETEDGMTSGWYDLYEFLDQLDSYESTNPFAANIHQRELNGLLNSI